jgi:glycine C-acetyltransferase
VDLFDKILKNYGPLGQYYKQGHGYFFFPKLEGRISNKMTFRGKEHLCWSLNNYIGLADHPEVRKTDAEAAAEWGFGSPMGARMMSGQTNYHEQLERDLASFVKKESAYLLNFGYPGMVSLIDALVDRHDVIVYDSEAHACILDGLRMVLAKRFVYKHSDMEALEKNLGRATKLVEKTGGSILVITEGVYGMVGDIAKLDQIVAMKKKYNFRLLVDDAHGFGTMGPTGAGTDEHLGVQDGVDVYFATFAKAMAMIGGFIASKKEVIDYLHYNMRSQVYAKSMPMPLVIGAMKRLELLKNSPELREKLWTIVHALRDGLRSKGFDMGVAESPVTPVFLKGSIQEATQVIYDLRENHRIFCNVVIYPVVPKDVIMIRLIPTATHTMEDVNYTIDCFAQVAEKLKNGTYSTTEYADISEK